MSGGNPGVAEEVRDRCHLRLSIEHVDGHRLAQVVTGNGEAARGAYGAPGGATTRRDGGSGQLPAAVAPALQELWRPWKAADRGRIASGSGWYGGGDL